MGSTESDLHQERRLLHEALGERHARVAQLDQDDAAFDAEYEQMVAEAERLLEFDRQLPARLAEPQRERSEQFVRWSWRGQSALAAALIGAVFLLGNTAWWLVLLVPHLLATFQGWKTAVTADRHDHQRRVAIGLHLLGLLVALVSLGVLSAWFITAVLIGWLAVTVAREDTVEKGRPR
ncbi:hypothetical protein ACF1FX_32370 [Streptomyces sp. NPDC014646]|uniref:hypothetical protein n=1 Tax=Streptomyces sp. NPDC014646 TaxID=3364877 RepID=UPI00370119C5